MEEYYKESLDHVHDELLLIDLLIHAQVIRHRALKKNTNELQGLYISEKEVDELLKGNPEYENWVKRNPNLNDEYEKLSQAIKALSSIIRKKLENSINKEIPLKLQDISRIYNLNTFEMEVISICLAPEFDSKYRKLFSYLQDDVTRKNPSVELILNMICSSFKEKTLVRRSFSTQSPLIKNNLIEFVYNPSEPDKPLIARDLKANERFVNYILEDERVDDELHVFTSYYKSDLTLSDLVLPPVIMERLEDFVSYYNTKIIKQNFLISFHGTYGSGKRDVAAAICNEIEVPLLEVDLFAMYNAGIYFERAIDLILRESRISFAAIYLKNCDFLFNEQLNYSRHYFIDQFDRHSLLTFISSSEKLPIHGEFLHQKLITIELPIPEYDQRKELWSRILKEYICGDNVDIKEIASKYNLSAGQINDIVSTAGVFALWHSPDNPVITANYINEATHIHSNQHLDRLAQRIEPKHKWGDIILEKEIKQQLMELVKMFKHKHVVYDEWGFNKKLSLGKGISALFFGVPGTGKTLAAEIIAAELGMDLYKIDISMVVSKYIGETEKNLAKIFDEAQRSNAILFFDEADAIFGKRTDVQDSHDRYSNIEVSYLLQRIDEYNGAVIMATNFLKNIDEAFKRRLHFFINFPAPDEKSRLAIWQNIFPKESPIAGNINFPLLAKEFDICGGHIKNIALQTAFYAADEQDPADRIITMKNIIRACRQEFKKIGRLWDKSSFPGMEEPS